MGGAEVNDPANNVNEEEKEQQVLHQTDVNKASQSNSKKAAKLQEDGIVPESVAKSHSSDTS
jgi:hypothetical protein